MSKIGYIYNRIVKKSHGAAIINSRLAKTSKIGADSTVIWSSLGDYSYAGYNCKIFNCDIGKFCSIADDVIIGTGGEHPLDWVSTSPAFYFGRDSIPKDLAKLDLKRKEVKTIIENDVWIGHRAIIKQGVKIGNGAVIGFGSIVTKDVPAYGIVVGNPARVIKYRFDDVTIDKLLNLKWWDFSKKKLYSYAEYMNDIDKFIKISQVKKV